MKRSAVRLSLMLLAVLLTTLLARFGFWQLDRAVDKQAQQDRYHARATAPPLPAEHLLRRVAEPRDLQFRRVEAAGHYDPQHQILLDNRTENGVAGYHVYTPLVVDPSLPVLLVNRGWVAAGPRREDLPSLDVASTTRLVRGTAELPRKDLFLLGEAGYATDGWPIVVQKLDPALVAALLGQRVAPVVLLLDAAQPDGYSRRWTPYLGISPDRHRGYAAQWFALSATLLVIAVSLFWRSLRAEKLQS